MQVIVALILRMSSEFITLPLNTKLVYIRLEAQLDLFVYISTVRSY